VILSNVRSLRNKLCEVGALVDDCRPDVLAFTETWLSTDVTDSEVCLPGYALLRCDRTSDRRGGGVVLYVNSALTVCKTYSFRSSEGDVEALAVNLCIASAQLKIVLVYRSPDSVAKGLADFIREHSANRCLVMGDFNLPDVDWQNFSCGAVTRCLATELLELALHASL
ncbi:unnamed protein product, partial [Dicrocoelium dendriticum]